MANVTAVHSSPDHSFSKTTSEVIEVVAGLGVVGDAHMGAQVKHRSRVKADPTQPNLRQVPLIASEVLAELGDTGFEVRPGQLGENVTTAGVDLLDTWNVAGMEGTASTDYRVEDLEIPLEHIVPLDQRVLEVDVVCYEHNENMAVLEHKEERRETAHW